MIRAVHREVVRPITRAIDEVVRSGFNPGSLFAASEQGAWYDPSDLSTMFQDSAGTTPVTAVGQPVGLVLDKRLGLVRGADVVVNGGFDSASEWSLQSGYTISGGLLNANVAASTFFLASQFVTLNAGKTYVVTYSIVSYTSGAIRARFAGGGADVNGVDRSALGTFSEVIVSTGNTALNLQARSGGFVGSIDNVSIRELPGNHATQATSAARPVLSARMNMLLWSNDPNAAASWSNVSSSHSSAGTFVADGQTFTGCAVASAGATWHRREQLTASTLPAGAATSVIAYIKRGTSNRFRLVVRNSQAATESIISGSLGSASVLQQNAGTLSNITSADLGNDIYRVSCTIVQGAAGQLLVGVGPDSAVSGENVVFLGAQAESAATPGRYQRVTTATDYDTAGFPYYLQFDGVDDSLATGSINFTATDKMTVFAGVRKESDAARGDIVELGVSTFSTNGSFAIIAPDQVSTATYGFYCRATAEAVRQASTFTAPHTAILSCAYDTALSGAEKTRPRVNGSVPTLMGTNDAGTGNFGNHPLYIGRRAGASLPFNGRIYGLVIRGAASTADQIAATERWLASKSGVTL